MWKAEKKCIFPTSATMYILSSIFFLLHRTVIEVSVCKCLPNIPRKQTVVLSMTFAVCHFRLTESESPENPTKLI